MYIMLAVNRASGAAMAGFKTMGELVDDPKTKGLVFSEQRAFADGTPTNIAFHTFGKHEKKRNFNKKKKKGSRCIWSLDPVKRILEAMITGGLGSFLKKFSFTVSGMAPFFMWREIRHHCIGSALKEMNLVLCGVVASTSPAGTAGYRSGYWLRIAISR